MKNRLKWLFLLSLTTIIILLGSCNNQKEKPNPTEFKNHFEAVEINNGDYNIKNDIYVQNLISYYDNVYDIKWSASSESCLKFNDNDWKTTIKGEIAPLNEKETTTVTAEVEYDNTIFSKTFTLVLWPLTEEEASLKRALNSIIVEEETKLIEEDFELAESIQIDNKKVALKWNSDSDNIQIEQSETKTLAKIFQINKQIEVTLKVEILYNEIKLEGFYFITIKETIEKYGYQEEIHLYIYENEIYNTKNEVCLYIVTFSKLPSNYYPKSEFYNLQSQWSRENLISCGGDVFQNREGLLPKNDSYFECDIEYKGGGRNALRVVFSLKTLSAYYTSDHYSSFEAVYIDGNFCA